MITDSKKMLFVSSVWVLITTFICVPTYLDGASLTPIWFSDDPILVSKIQFLKPLVTYTLLNDMPHDIESIK